MTKKERQLYEAMNVPADNNPHRMVWDFTLNKSRLLKDMSAKEIELSIKASNQKLKNENRD